MSGGFESAGEIATGAMIGRAVEPTHGEATSGHDGACLNCGAVLAGPYCGQCGQAAHFHRSLLGLWHDIAHGVFHFEGKVFRTLPMLAWRPGDLTRRYIHGERARFVSPLALFLFSVFLMFAIFESVGGPIVPTVNQPGSNSGLDINITDLKVEREKAELELARLERDRARILAEGKSTVQIDAALTEQRGNLAGLKVAKVLTEGASTEELPDMINVETESKEFNERVKAALKNPKLLLYKMQSTAYKFAWALIPLSLPFMWLLFAWRRQYRLYDHAIFVTYSLSAIIILLVIMALLAAAGVQPNWALMLIPVHIFRQLKQAYQLGWLSALWRTVAVSIVAVFVLVLFVVGLLALGLLS